MDLWNFIIIVGVMNWQKLLQKVKYLGVERQAECFLEDGFPIIELDREYDEQVQNRFN